MAPRIITVAARKGGIGKTTLAYELAYVRNAVLLDLEWDGSSVSKKFGYRHQDRVRDPLLSGLESGRPPRPLNGGGRKPDLVPGSPSLNYSDISSETMADTIEAWAEQWGRDVVIDTHPGASEAAFGAMSVAHVVAVPTTLYVDDLAGAEDMLDEHADYPLVVVPNKVRGVPQRRAIDRLARLTEGRAAVAPPIPEATLLHNRTKRIAVTAEDPPAKKLQPFATAIRRVNDFMEDFLNAS